MINNNLFKALQFVDKTINESHGTIDIEQLIGIAVIQFNVDYKVLKRQFLTLKD